MLSQRLKSKTYWLAITTAVLGVLSQYIPMFQEFLGENYPFVFVGIAILSAIVREMTTKPLSEK